MACSHPIVGLQATAQTSSCTFEHQIPQAVDFTQVSTINIVLKHCLGPVIMFNSYGLRTVYNTSILFPLLLSSAKKHIPSSYSY